MNGLQGLASGIVGGVGNIASTAGTAVEGTTALAKKATDIALKTTGSAVDAAGVLGNATLNAASKLSETAIASTGAVGSKGIDTAASVTTSALDAANKITSAALGTTSKLTESTLNATSKITDAALDATTNASEVALDVASTTVDKTADVLKAGVNAGSQIAASGLNGLRRISEIVAQKGDLAATKMTANTSAQSKAFESFGVQRLNTQEALKEFNKYADQLRSGIERLVSVQKTVLAANVNMYRKLQCGWLKRVFGKCPPGVSTDITNAKAVAYSFLESFDTARAAAGQKISTGNDPAAVVGAYLQEIDKNSNKFQAEFSAIIEKYRNLVSATLDKTGGRKKRLTYRAKKNRRVSRKRRAVRAYFA